MKTIKADKQLGVIIKEFKKGWTLPVLLFFITIPFYLMFQSLSFLFAIAALSPSLYLMADRIRYRVYLYERGLSKRDLFGETTVHFQPGTQFWYSVTKEFINGIPAGTHINIRIRDASNTVKLRSSIIGIENLRDMIVEVEKNIIAPVLINAYLEGKQIDFSVIKIKQGYLFIGSKSLDASHISRMELERGIFSIWQHEQRAAFCKLRTTDIPNLYSFFEIMQSVVSGTSTIERNQTRGDL
jgi:hypothetical protein